MAGSWTATIGMCSVVLGFFLGAGPCNALTGMIAMVVGILAIPIGAVLFVIGMIRHS